MESSSNPRRSFTQTWRRTRQGNNSTSGPFVVDSVSVQKLLKQGYPYHKLLKTYSNFYRRYYNLISKFQIGLQSLLRQGLPEPEFYGDLVYDLKKIVGSNNFSAQFIKIITHYKRSAITLMHCTDCMLGGQPNHGWQLCFPL